MGSETRKERKPIQGVVVTQVPLRGGWRQWRAHLKVSPPKERGESAHTGSQTLKGHRLRLPVGEHSPCPWCSRAGFSGHRSLQTGELPLLAGKVPATAGRWATRPVCTGAAHCKVRDGAPPAPATRERPQSPERGRRADTNRAAHSRPSEHGLAGTHGVSPTKFLGTPSDTRHAQQHSAHTTCGCVLACPAGFGAHTPAPPHSELTRAGVPHARSEATHSYSGVTAGIPLMTDRVVGTRDGRTGSSSVRQSESSVTGSALLDLTLNLPSQVNALNQNQLPGSGLVFRGWGLGTPLPPGLQPSCACSAPRRGIPGLQVPRPCRHSPSLTPRSWGWPAFCPTAGGCLVRDPP